MHPREVLDLLRASEALLEGHFLLSSGNHSDRYFQCALVLQHPTRAERLARSVALRAGVTIDAVIGPALGAVTWAHEVARACGARALFAEREEGRFKLRRGFELREGERVLVVEDVLTTGGSAAEVLDLVEAAGARAVGVGAIVNRSGGNPFQARGIPCIALADVRVEMWAPAECPLCKRGGQAVKPGSRTVPAEASAR